MGKHYRWNSQEMAKFYDSKKDKKKARESLCDITGYPMLVVREALRFEGFLRPSELDVLPGLGMNEQIMFLKAHGFSKTATASFLGQRYDIVKPIYDGVRA